MAALTGVAFAGKAPADVKVLIASDRPPFAASNWPGEGMIAELVQQAWALSPGAEPGEIIWAPSRDEASAQLDAGGVDLSFPWDSSDCNDERAVRRACVNVHLSDPIIEVAVLMFVRAEHEFPFDTRADLSGRTLCRASDDVTGGRGEAYGAVALRRATAAHCFEALVAGAVDAVAVDEFSGVQHLFESGLTETVVPLPQPLTTQPLYVVASRTHWRGTALIYRLNTGLAKLRQTEAYAETIARHVGLFWDHLKRH
ncbi:substrate-binding periplasmic protein [Roseobacter sp. A03A-229]